MARKKTATASHPRIDHSVFGLGTVVEANDHYTTIAFDENGTRKFLTSMVKVEPSSTPAPARPRRKKAAAKAKPKAKPKAKLKA